MFRLSLLVGLLAACGGGTESRPWACDEGKCLVPERSFCDVDGVYPDSEGEPNTCIATPKQRYCAKTGPMCVDDVFYDCVAETFMEGRDCLLGCNDVADDCQIVTPSNGLRPYLESAHLEHPVSFRSSTTINTDTGEVKEGDTSWKVKSFMRNGTVPIRVFVVGEWYSENVVVEGEAALAIVSSRGVYLAGDIDLGTSGYFPGDETIQCAPDWETSECSADKNRKAGSGQSNRGAGGAGGWMQNRMPGFASDTLVPLHGGCGRQSGGALQIVANDLISIAGNIIAVGQGGTAAQCGVDSFATGGGAGGSVLLEAPQVKFASGGVYATGGSGACAGPNTKKQGAPGPLAKQAAPPVNCGSDAGISGAGGYVDDGGDGSTGTSIYHGAGGGGVGHIRINTLVGGASLELGELVPDPSVSESLKVQ